MASTLIKNGTFLTMRDDVPEMSGYMVIEDDRITYLGETEPAGKEYDEVIDGAGRLYMPGFVNTHGHAAMSLLRGYGDDLSLQVWLEQKIWPNEAKFESEDVKWATLLSIVEMLQSGTTTFVDMYDHMDDVALAVEESGMRACLTRGMIGLAPQDVCAAKLREARKFVADWHGKADGRITTMMSPHSAYTCPPSFIRDVVEAAHDLDVPIHTHMSETEREVALNVEQYGERPVKHLQNLGVFTRPCLVAHAVHLTDTEIEILRDNQVHVSHNIGSNLKLASGVARVPDLLRAGVPVSLGTDSSASNNNLDMLEEVRLAALVHKGVSGDPTAIPAWEALKMGTVNGAQSLWLTECGTLKAGKKADFIGLDIDQVHFLPRTDLVSHLVYAASAGDVRDVWVNGRALVRSGVVLSLDVERIKHEFTARYDRLMSS